jgi:hypothetical protein
MDNTTNLTEPWNIGIMSLLKKVAEASLGYKWMHDHEYNYYSNLDGRYTKIEMVLMGLMTLLIGSDFLDFIINSNFQNNAWVKGSVLALQMIIVIIYTFVKGMREFANIPERILKHNTSSFRFGEIHAKIQEQFVLNVSRRESDKEFMQNTVQIYNTLIFDSLDIRGSTMKKYMREVKDKNIYKPVALGGLDEVQILFDEQIGNNIDLEETADSSLYNYEINKWTSHLKN